VILLFCGHLGKFLQTGVAVCKILGKGSLFFTQLPDPVSIKRILCISEKSVDLGEEKEDFRSNHTNITQGQSYSTSLSPPLPLSSLLANNKAPCTFDFISLFLTVSLQLIVAEAAVAVRPLTCSSDSCFSKILRRMVLMSWKQERRND
jgi:hypothetical protein